jgi:hypothetical protein
VMRRSKKPGKLPGLTRNEIEMLCDFPFDSFDLEALDRLAQGGESFDSAQDREPVERPVETI